MSEKDFYTFFNVYTDYLRVNNAYLQKHGAPLVYAQENAKHFANYLLENFGKSDKPQVINGQYLLF